MRDHDPVESRVRSFIERHELLKGIDHLLVAVSGGPDSVALLHLLHRLKNSLSLACISVLHFDHELRGEESCKDAAFVRSMAENLQLPFILGRENVAAYRESHGLSLEMAARVCRHRFFQEALGACGARCIALGHTANDQAEEILLRLFRGTGPAGLAAMPPRSKGGLIRPILFLTRREVLTYLRVHGLPHREDASNFTASCRRNVLRNEVLPLVEKHFHGSVVPVLCRCARLALDEEDFWSREVEREWKRVEDGRSPTRISLRLSDFLGMHPALQRRLIRHAIALLKGDRYGLEAVHVEAVLQLVRQSTSGRRVTLPGALQAFKEGGSVAIEVETPNGMPVNVPETLVREPGIAFFGTLRFRFSLEERQVCEAGGKSRTERMSAFLDAEKVLWPVTVRHWKPGDRFQPFGMKGSKKLQDFLVDAGIPRRVRGEIPLVCDREKICWVVGHRIDERVKVAEETRKVLCIETRWE